MEFRRIAGWPGYWISDAGDVRSQRGKGASSPGAFRVWHKMTPAPNKKGYLRVTLRRNGLLRKRRVHRIVLEAFEGPCPPGMECRHGDGDPANNNLWNLSWGTPEENWADRKRHAALKG